MNFIDISGWQKGLDLEAVFNKNPSLHGVIVKSTEGDYYVNDTCDPWVQTAKKLGRPWGFYHYLSGKDAVKEADFWYKHTSNYFKDGMPCADYEGDALKKGTGYLKKFLDRIFDLTGVRPLVYCSLNVVRTQDFKAIAKDGYQLWLAQYADNKYTGIQEVPWQSGSVAPFSRYVMHQYASTGRLSGWNGNLDLDKFFGDMDDWEALVKGYPIPSSTGGTLKGVDPQVVEDVMAGKYGINEERRRKLTQAGYMYEEVQNKLNELYTLAEKIRPYKEQAGDYWNTLIGRIV